MLNLWPALMPHLPFIKVATGKDLLPPLVASSGLAPVPFGVYANPAGRSKRDSRRGSGCGGSTSSYSNPQSLDILCSYRLWLRSCAQEPLLRPRTVQSRLKLEARQNMQ